MKKGNIKIYAIFIALCLGVGLFAGLLTMDSMEIYMDGIEKPAISPPGILFPIVWTLLYTLMGISGARIWLSPNQPGKQTAMNVYFIQLAVNFFWSLLFFNAMAFGFAFFWLLLLWVMIGVMIYLFWKIDPLAGLLQIPYFLWVTFAAVLNFLVWRMN